MLGHARIEAYGSPGAELVKRPVQRIPGCESKREAPGRVTGRTRTAYGVEFMSTSLASMSCSTPSEVAPCRCTLRFCASGGLGI